MKPIRIRKRLPALAAAAGGLAFSAGALYAAPFVYNPGDLVLTFRQAGNASDLVVNVGKATAYSGLPAGTSIPVTNLTAAQFAAAFPSVNGLRWSVAAANRPPVDPNYPLQTLWVTAPRTDPDAAAKAWLRKGQFVQGNAGSQIDGVGINAALTSSLLPGGPNNTATGIVLPVAAAYAIGPVLGAEGNYVGTFQGSVENVTPDDFDADTANVSRSDLYELIPGTTAAGTLNAPGRALGFFELKADGTLAFKTGSATPPPVPHIDSIVRNGDVATVSVTSAAGFNYRLRHTDAAGLGTPVSSWPTGPAVPGTGGVLALEDRATDGIRYYVVEARP